MSKIYSDDVSYAIKNLPLVNRLNCLAEISRDFIVVAGNLEKTDTEIFYHLALMLGSAVEEVLCCLAMAQDERITEHDRSYGDLEKYLWGDSLKREQ